eukprot:SAG31_NODE_894_length_11172_cov_25.790572_4_plen_173_part_00
MRHTCVCLHADQFPFDHLTGDQIDTATFYSRDAWFDTDTALAYRAAYRVTGGPRFGLNWVCATLFCWCCRRCCRRRRCYCRCVAAAVGRRCCCCCWVVVVVVVVVVLLRPRLLWLLRLRLLWLLRLRLLWLLRLVQLLWLLRLVQLRLARPCKLCYCCCLACGGAGCLRCPN